MNKNGIRLRFILTDFAAAALAWVAFYFWRRHVLHNMGDGVFFELDMTAIEIGAFWTLLYTFFGFYKEVLRQSRTKELLSMLKINGIGLIIIILIILNDALFVSRDIREYENLYRNIVTYFLIHFIIGASFKLGIMTWSKNLIRMHKVWYNTLLIGSGLKAAEIFEEIEKYNSHLGLRFSGFVDTGESPDAEDESGSIGSYNKSGGSAEALLKPIIANMPAAEKTQWLGNYNNLENIIKEQRIEQAIIAIEHNETDKLEAILNYAEGYGVRMSVMPEMYQILLGSVKVSHILGTPLIEIKTDLLPAWAMHTKRAMDIFVAVCVLGFGAVFYLIIALLTRLSSPGPIFYMQERIGIGGKPFKIIKFRSMYINAEKQGPRLSSQFDPRITPWGRIMRKTRLDEFPQFWNVLVGDMSLVGPRPERQYFIDQIVKVAPHYKHLNRVRPGITSLGQVKFGYAENVDQMVRRLKYDILYIENMSLGMDLKIIAYTILTMLKGSGK
ncbi:MAG: sugar transferase [Bacteroidota bacterium]